jgi:cell division protein FtsL
MSSQQITSQIESAYSTSADLEVKRSVLASPSRIQSIASEQLGMGPAASISYLDVSNARATANVGAISDTECALSAAVTQIAAGA